MKKTKADVLLIIAGILLGVACMLFAHFFLVGCRVQQPRQYYKSDVRMEVSKPDTTNHN